MDVLALALLLITVIVDGGLAIISLILGHRTTGVGKAFSLILPIISLFFVTISIVCCLIGLLFYDPEGFRNAGTYIAIPFMVLGFLGGAISLVVVIIVRLIQGDSNPQKTSEPVISDDKYAEIMALKELFDSGVITEEEFALKKKDIFRRK